MSERGIILCTLFMFKSIGRSVPLGNPILIFRNCLSNSQGFNKLGYINPILAVCINSLKDSYEQFTSNNILVSAKYSFNNRFI